MKSSKKNRHVRPIPNPDGCPQGPCVIWPYLPWGQYMCPNLSHRVKEKPQWGQEIPWLSCEPPNCVTAHGLPGVLVSNTAEIFCNRLVSIFDGFITGHGPSGHVYGSWWHFSRDSCWSGGGANGARSCICSQNWCREVAGLLQIVADPPFIVTEEKSHERNGHD